MELELGQSITIDNVTVEILGIKNPEICEHLVNNSSVVMKLGNVERSILFTGDLMSQGGLKFFDPLMGPYLSRLETEYVQMSHHGNDGVDESFYKLVNPRVAIWAMPYWLFTDNIGSGPCMGPWEPGEVICWMKDLSVPVHCYLFDIPLDGAQLIPCDCGGLQLSPCDDCT